MPATHLEMHRRIGRADGQMCESKVKQGTMESGDGKWVLTTQFFPLFCMFLNFYGKMVEEKLNLNRCRKGF